MSVIKSQNHLATYAPQAAKKNKRSTTTHKAGRPSDDRTTGVAGHGLPVGSQGSSALFSMLLFLVLCFGVRAAAEGEAPPPGAGVFTIVATAGMNGAIEPSGVVTVISGRDQAFTITPNANYQIQTVYVDGADIGPQSQYTFRDVKENHLINVVFKITEGSFTIVAGVGPNGAIEPSGTVGVKSGATQKFTITPAANYEIADVLVDAQSKGPVPYYEFPNVTGNHSIMAYFKLKAGYFSIAASAGLNGTIDPTGAIEVAAGSTQSFAIKADANYVIADVLVDGASVGAVPSYEFPNVSANHVIYASFKLASGMFVIVATPGVNGTVSPSGTIEVEAGSNKLFKFIPDQGYAVSDVWVDGVSVGARTSYEFKGIDASHAIAAAFVSTTGPYTIVAIAGPNGTLSPSGAVSVGKGASQSFTLTPNAGFHVSDVLIDGVSKGALPGYTFTDVTANHEIFATFAADTDSYTIIATMGMGGTVSPSGSVSVAKGGSKTFTITPSSGFYIEKVLVDGRSEGTDSAYTFDNVTANHTLYASFGGGASTYTITASTGAGGTITPSGAITVSVGCTYEFFFTPDSGYQIADVLVDDVSQGAVSTYTFRNISANHTIKPTFNLVGGPYVLVSSAGSGGTITPSGSSQVSSGGSQSYTIAPSTNYVIADVLVDGKSVGAVTIYPFTNVTANHTITASFALKSDYHTISASAGQGGVITPSGTVLVETAKSQTFTITASEGYEIEDVIVDGLAVGAVATYPFTNVTADHAIAATFKSIAGPYTITAAAGANGNISPTGAVMVPKGSEQSFAITANDGYLVSSVYVDGVSAGAVASYTFSNVTSNHSIQAEFVSSNGPFTVVASAGAGGRISPSGAQDVVKGASLTFEIAADPDYEIADVLVDGVSAGPVPTYTFSNVQAGHVIEASFSAVGGPYAITTTASVGGAIEPAGTVTVAQGESQTFVLAPQEGYSVSDVRVDGVSIGVVFSYAFVNVQANHTIFASFAVMTPITVAKVDISTDSSKTNVDKISIGGGEILFESFDPSSQTVTVQVDGVSFVCSTSTGSWKTSGSGSSIKYSFASSTDTPSYKLTFDFKKKQWAFKASKTDAWKKIDNAAEVYIMLSVSEVVYGCKLAMVEKTSWSFSGDKNPAPTPLANLPGEPMTIFTFGTKAKISGKRDNSKEQADSFKITSGKGDIKVQAFDETAVSLSLDDLAISFGNFAQDKSGKPVFTYKSASDVKPKYSVKFDLEEADSCWTFSMTSGECSAIRGGEAGVNIILAIGDYVGGVNVKLFQKTRLTYKAE